MTEERSGGRRVVVLAGLLAMASVGLGAWFVLQGPTAPQPVEYTVVRGDTLFEIAREHGVTVDQLRVWNGIEGDLIEVGQVLEIHSDDEAPVEPVASGGRKRRRTTSGGGVKVPDQLEALPAERPKLTMPAPRRCKQGPELSDLDDEAEMVGSTGLSEAQIRGAMNGFLNHALYCVPDGWSQGGTLRTELTVGCDGRVSGVRVLDGGPFPAEMVACVKETLGYAGFPAHDIEGGMTFEYPVRISF